MPELHLKSDAEHITDLPKILKELEPFAAEARKYKSAEEFEGWWHKEEASIFSRWPGLEIRGNLIKSGFTKPDGYPDYKSFWEVAQKENPTTMIPWQMTQKEFVDAQKKDYEEAGLELREGTKLAEKFESYQKDYHKEWVETALKDGKFIPAKVLRDYPELKKKYTQYFKGGDNPMSERIKDTGLGVGGTPRRGKPKTEKERKEEHISSGLDSIDKHAGQPIILINIETGKVIPGGRVVSEKKALATPCHGYDIGEGKRMLWSKGVVGTLSLPEQEKFCKVGTDLKPMTGRLKKRITALREAGIEF